MDSTTVALIYLAGMLVCGLIATIVYKATGEEGWLEIGVMLSIVYPILLPAFVIVLAVLAVGYIINLLANMIMVIFKIKKFEPKDETEEEE